MARDHSRLRKLLQVQRHHLVNAELAVRWWAHFDIFHHYTSVPIHTAVPATDLFATEQFLEMGLRKFVFVSWFFLFFLVCLQTWFFSLLAQKPKQQTQILHIAERNFRQHCCKLLSSAGFSAQWSHNMQIGPSGFFSL